MSDELSKEERDLTIEFIVKQKKLFKNCVKGDVVKPYILTELENAKKRSTN